VITHGYSKTHRPDLKQLLLILSTQCRRGMPVQQRAADGNSNHSVTHIETGHTLKAMAGRADFTLCRQALQLRQVQ
jgi:transposase